MSQVTAGSGHQYSLPVRIPAAFPFSLLALGALGLRKDAPGIRRTVYLSRAKAFSTPCAIMCLDSARRSFAGIWKGDKYPVPIIPLGQFGLRPSAARAQFNFRHPRTPPFKPAPGRFRVTWGHRNRNFNWEDDQRHQFRRRDVTCAREPSPLPSPILRRAFCFVTVRSPRAQWASRRVARYA